MAIPLQQLINDSVREPRESRKITSWHISKLGQCLRGVYLERAGAKPDTEFDDRTLRVFSVGKMLEDWLIDKIKDQKDITYNTQVRVKDKKLNVSGYADLVIEYQDEKQVYEIKSKHSKAFWWMSKNGEGASDHNKQQLWMYLRLLNIEKGSLIYLSKDDLAILEYPVFLSDKKIENEIMAQLNLLNKAWKSQDPSLLPLPGDKDWLGKYCRWHSKCKNL